MRPIRSPISATAQQTLLILGFIVAGTSLCAMSVWFSTSHKTAEQKLLDEALAQRRQAAAGAQMGSAATA